MNINRTSASSMSFDNLNFGGTFVPGESEKCSGCGRPLNWYGEMSDGHIISSGWHRQPYAQNSYVYNLCDKCCQKHLSSMSEKVE